MDKIKELFASNPGINALKSELAKVEKSHAELVILFDNLSKLFDENTQQDEFEEIMNEKIIKYETVLYEIKETEGNLETKIADLFEESEMKRGEERRHQENLQILQIEMKKLQLEEERDRSRKESSKPTTIKLHPLKPMSFDGDPISFPTFLSNWNATVHQQNISDEAKLRYLQDALGPEPRKTIMMLRSGSQYDLAIHMLKQKYGNETLIRKAYYASLENLPTVSDNDIATLSTFSENLEILTHGLQECGVNIEDQDFVFHLIFQKLPETLRFEFSKSAQGLANLSIQKLQSLLNEYITTARDIAYQPFTKQVAADEEQCFTAQTHQRKLQQPQRFQNRNPHRYEPQYNKKVSPSYQPRYPPKPRFPCVFCKRINHFSDECRQFLTREARIKQLGASCHKCLKPNHTADNCYRRIWCPHCQTTNLHNRSLCPVKFTTKNELTTNPFTQTSATKDTGTSNHSNSEEANVCQAVTECHEQALMTTEKTEYMIFPTAVATVKSSSRQSPKQRCRIAFDTMSSRSYVTTSVAQQLKLVNKSHEKLSVHTFASTEPKTISSYRSEIDIETMHGNDIKVDISVVNSIEAKVFRAPLESDVLRTKLDGLFLADPSPLKPEVCSVDILIGNDFYDIFVNSSRKELVPGKLWLKESVLGWIITGRVTSTRENCHHPPIT